MTTQKHANTKIKSKKVVEMIQSYIAIAAVTVNHSRGGENGPSLRAWPV